MGQTLRSRLTALLALALPVLAGLGYLQLAGAPANYLLVNAGALVVALLLVLFVSAPRSLRVRRGLTLALLLALFVPLATGPSVEGVARWLPLGPFLLHTAGLLVPAILVLALRDKDYAAPILLTAIFAGLLQPDAAIGFAIVFAAIGFHDVSKDWRIGLVTIFAFFAAIVMAIRGNPPPQPFVERVLIDAAGISPLLMAGLFLSLASSFFLILRTIHAPRSMRYTLAGSLFGFTILSIMNHYPSVLIGYGAAPILGYGLALALACGDTPEVSEANGA